MVAAVDGVDLRGTAELAHGHHDGGFQQPALFQVHQQRRESLVQSGAQQSPQLLVVLSPRAPAVGVPAAVQVVTGRGDEAGAGFHQAPRQQGALSESVAAVGVLGLLRLLREIEGLLHDRGEDHLHGLVPKRLARGRFHQDFPASVEAVHHL